MQIAGISQTFSFTAVRLTLSTRGDAPAPAPPTGEPADRVTLSPAATTATASTGLEPLPPVEGQGGTDPLPPESLPPTPAGQRADALFSALDADDDGAISEQEFTEGAKQLLRHAGARHRLHGHDDDDRHHAHGHHEGRGVRRLERRLEKLFDRVDADGDGSIAKHELTDALARVDARRDGGAPTPLPPSEGQAPQTGAVTVRLTVVSVSFAVQRYAAVQQGATADPAPTAPPVPLPPDGGDGTDTAPPQAVHDHTIAA